MGGLAGRTSELVSELLFRGLGALYFVAFVAVLKQFRPLLGERGLLPVPDYVARTEFWGSPSLFYWRYSDRLLMAVAGLGLALSALIVTGVPLHSFSLSMGIWLTLWALYLSVVNVGQHFYGFGWESMLLEAGFFAAFLGPAPAQWSWIPVWILRWMLFRVEFGAGLIKLRHDKCWRDLTCLHYHYESQPIPNATSWYFHRLPGVMHKASVLGSHFIQLVVPFGLFLPQPIAAVAGGLLMFHQFWLIVSGNYAWLNWLTLVLGFSAFPALAWPEGPAWAGPLLVAVGVGTLLLSVQPTMNLFSKHQLMNHCYNPWRLVNTYGAFGSVTRKRYEIVLEGLVEGEWREYDFKAKPGRLDRRPPQVAPYHLRLDWQMWFLPFSGPRFSKLRDGWFLMFAQKLLQGDAATLGLLGPTPWGPPESVRAQFYHYRYSTGEERRATGHWWVRQWVCEYMPATRLKAALDRGGLGGS